MQMILPMVCNECQGEVRFVTSIASFGAAPGAHFYECKMCGHVQVQEFTSAPAGAPAQSTYSDVP